MISLKGYAGSPNCRTTFLTVPFRHAKASTKNWHTINGEDILDRYRLN